MMSKDQTGDSLAEEPFSYQATKDGKLLFYWQGKLVSTLKGNQAGKLLARLSDASTEQAQLALAKATGNFKRGNER